MVATQPVEPGQPPREPLDELAPAGHLGGPAEEVVLDHAQDAGLIEPFPGDEVVRLQPQGVDADNQVRDDVRAVHQQGVFDEQVRVVDELGAQGAVQQLRPQLPLQLDGRLLLVLCVERGERGAIQLV